MLQLVTEIYGWEEGWRYLASMAAVARFVDSSGAVRDAVKRGEALFGPMVDYYVFIAGLEYCIPTDGTDILFDPVAVPRGANMTIAALLTRVVLTDVDKRLVDRYILPGNPAVLDSPDVNQTKAAVLKKHLQKLMSARVLAVPPEKSASYYYSFIYYYEATLVDLQDLLTDTWTEAIRAYLAGKITDAQLNDIWRLLGAPVNFTDPDTGARKTFTYQVAVELNDRVGKDPAYRDKVYQVWREAARVRYQRAAQLLDTYISTANTNQTQPQQATNQVNTQPNAALIIIISLLATLAVVLIFKFKEKR